jgi:hypothetical protein
MKKIVSVLLLAASCAYGMDKKSGFPDKPAPQQSINESQSYNDDIALLHAYLDRSLVSQSLHYLAKLKAQACNVTYQKQTDIEHAFCEKHRKHVNTTVEGLPQDKKEELGYITDALWNHNSGLNLGAYKALLRIFFPKLDQAKDLIDLEF